MSRVKKHKVQNLNLIHDEAGDWIPLFCICQQNIAIRRVTDDNNRRNSEPLNIGTSSSAKYRTDSVLNTIKRRNTRKYQQNERRREHRHWVQNTQRKNTIFQLRPSVISPEEVLNRRWMLVDGL